MLISRYPGTVLREHWKYGVVVFLYSFTAILAALTLAVPHLSPEIVGIFVDPIKGHMSSSTKTLLLISAAQSTPEDRASEELKPAPPPPSRSESVHPQASSFEAPEIAVLSHLGGQLRKLEQREITLRTEIRRHTEKQEQSAHGSVSSPQAPVVAQIQQTPEESNLREQINQAKRKLASLAAYDTDLHPDVVSAEDELLTLQGKLQQLEIEQWEKREPTHPTLTQSSQASESELLEEDKKAINSLIAAESSIQQQIVLVQLETGTLRMKIRDQQAGSMAAPLSSANVSAAVQPTYIHPVTTSTASPRLTWLGGMVLGTPVAFTLALIIAIGAMLFAEDSDARIKPAVQETFLLR